MNQDLQGKTAIITGASRGIGLGIAQELIERGAKVCLTARTAETLQQVVKAFPEDSAIFVAGKSHDPSHRREVLNAVATKFGGLDILVNNAGINPVYGHLADLDLNAARKVFEVNVFGTLAWTQEVLRHPGLNFRQRGGRIVNLSSVTGERPSPNIGLYGVSKAAVSHLTRTLAVELGPEVRVNAVAPALVKTNFAKALYEGREEDVTSQYPLGRLGTPEDIAKAVGYLASDDSTWVTGQVINLDGGLIVAGGRA
ncbi:SDR family oxidoreductase [Arthrobacter sp. NPDC089319]|uniref:SDR family oxidoreductase n=1 Tax=Arthrobacter sp. NPDC089319 TaxID=3155915 RepID=UPI00343B23E2